MWSGTEIEIELTFIRHGATAFNLEHRYLGQTETELSKEGIQELRNKKEKYRHLAAASVFSGPMKRCRQTAELLFPEQGIRLIPEWTEIDFGHFEGKNYQELSGNAEYQRWLDSGGTLPFPGGESREAFVRRTEQGFFRMLTELGQVEKACVAAVVHGGTIMALCSILSGGEYFSYQTACGEGYFCHVRYENKRIRLLELRKL